MDITIDERIKLTGFEQDAFTGWRHVLAYMRRARTRKKAKRQYWKRVRRMVKRQLREELLVSITMEEV